MDLRKSVDCVYFLKGQCRNGGACPFKHDPAKIASGVALSPAPAAKQTEDCYYFLHGRCSKGSQCLFRHDQTKLKPNPPPLGAPTNPSTVPASAANIPAPVPPIQAALPAKALGKAAELKNAPLDTQKAQPVDRKRKDIEDSSNRNAGVPPSQPAKPAPPPRKVPAKPAPLEDAVFNAPKTIEEIRAQKKAKAETKPVKAKTPAAAPVAKAIPTKAPASTRAVKKISAATDTSGEEKPAVNTEQQIPDQDADIIEDEDIGDFDVDGVDDDDFEAQMRALEDAL